MPQWKKYGSQSSVSADRIDAVLPHPLYTIRTLILQNNFRFLSKINRKTKGMTTFEPSGWSFGGSRSPPPPTEKYPIKRFEPTLRKFVKVADIDLGRLEQHKMNIERLRAVGDVEGLRKEHINTRRTVQQLQAHMRELEHTRRQVQDGDLLTFDKKVVGIQQKMFQAGQAFLQTGQDFLQTGQDFPQTGQAYPQAGQMDGLPIGALTDSPDVAPLLGEARPLLGEARPLLGEARPLLGEARLQAQIARQHEEDADTATRESWLDLEKELTDLNGIIHYFATMVTSQQEQVDRIDDNIDTSAGHVDEGVRQLGMAAKWKAAMLPAVGALLGGAVGGPVGLVAGVKLGGLAALGGGLIGITGGTLIKKRQQRVNEMELQNLSQRNAKSLPELPTKTPTDNEDMTITTHTMTTNTMTNTNKTTSTTTSTTTSS